VQPGIFFITLRVRECVCLTLKPLVHLSLVTVLLGRDSEGGLFLSFHKRSEICPSLRLNLQNLDIN
jgi:hypothetical protein